MSDYDHYKFNPTDLKKTRKLGISGLMRVKNEEKFLSLSIDSCIDALDELIICYQKSDDNSAEIIEKKKITISG